MKASSLSLLILLSTAQSSLSWSPIIPPRFDTFSEQLLGTWTCCSDQSDQSTDYGVVGCVEEVMRSCGGAVQGIREVPVDTNDEGVYHNRADDGFIFFDCGSYTQGVIEQERLGDGLDPKATKPSSLMGSLSFETIPKSRVLFHTMGLPTTDEKEEPYIIQSLVRSTSEMTTRKNNNDEENNGNNDDTSLDTALESDAPIDDVSIEWHTNFICRMPTSSQPWNLQRAKFEKDTKSLPTDTVHLEKHVYQDIRDVNIKGWVKNVNIERCTEEDDYIHHIRGYNTLSDDVVSFLKNTKPKIIQMGAICMTTGLVKALLRCYDSNTGNLRAVILQNGSMCT